MHGAAQIVDIRGSDLRNSNAGRQLYHLFTRHQLAYYRRFKVLNLSSYDLNRWKNLVYYTEVVNTYDIRDGHLDFEIAWLELMKIMTALIELRIGLGHNDDNPERRAKGAEIREMLKNWKITLSQQFQPIEMPEEVKPLESYIPTGLKPIFYRSLNAAIAMGKIFTYAVDINSALFDNRTLVNS